MSLPNFLIVGAMKSGTTTLKEYLRNHEDIFMVRDEIHFFNKEHNYAQGLEWYEEFFRDAAGQPAIGEKTPSYYHTPQVPARIHEHLPNAKLIWIFRDPVERAYSHYWHYVRKGHDRLDFETAIKGALKERRAKRNGYHGYLELGEYARHIKTFLEFFPKNRMLFLVFEDLVLTPEVTLNQVFSFLEVTPSLKLDKLYKRNVGYRPRSVYLNWILRKLFRESISTGLIDRINEKNAKPGYPPMTEKARLLLKQYYQNHNLELAKLIGRDLSLWG